jgi:CPA2 family monovalent cation:H+ antiporter-2
MNHTSTSSLPQLFSPDGSSPAPLLPDTIVQDFAVIMIVAAIILLVTYRLKQPMVLGYILAGIIIGPYTPPFPLLQDIETINILQNLE